MNKKDHSIIFCQSPANIAAVLNCYENELKENRNITIIIRNVQNLKKFIDILNLNAEIIYFDDNFSLFREFFQIKKLIKQKLKEFAFINNKGTNIFFTDICDDPLIGLYLKKLNKCNIYWIKGPQIIGQLTNEDLSNGFAQKNLPSKYKIKEIILSLLYGYSYKFIQREHWAITINIFKYKYPMIDYSDISVVDRFKMNVIDKKTKNVLFFTEPYRNKFQTEENYNKLNTIIINELHKAGYKIAIKGHPRIGCQKDTLELADIEIPPFIPSEFLNFNQFEFAIGFASTALCFSSQYIKSFSILPICEIIDRKEADYWFKYLSNYPNSKVIFLNALKDISNYLA